MPNQFRCPTAAVDDKGDLSVKGLRKIIASALRKYLILVTIYLCEQMIAVPNNADHHGSHFVAADVPVVQLRIDGYLFVIAEGKSQHNLQDLCCQFGRASGVGIKAIEMLKKGVSTDQPEFLYQFQ